MSGYVVEYVKTRTFYYCYSMEFPKVYMYSQTCSAIVWLFIAESGHQQPFDHYFVPASFDYLQLYYEVLCYMVYLGLTGVSSQVCGFFIFLWVSCGYGIMVFVQAVLQGSANSLGLIIQIIRWFVTAAF